MYYLCNTQASKAAHDAGDRGAALVHVKDAQAAVRAARAHSRHSLWRAAVDAHLRDRVLVRRVELAVVADARASDCAEVGRAVLGLRCMRAARVGRTEAVERLVVQAADSARRQGRRFGRRRRRPRLGRRGAGRVERAHEAPSLRHTALEHHRLAVVPGSHECGLRDELDRDVRQRGEAHHIHGVRRLLWRRRVHDSKRGVVADERQRVAARRERHALDPAKGGSRELAAHGAEGKALAPDTWRGLGVDALDVRAEDARDAVRASRGEEHIVRVPVERRDGRAQRALDVLGNPPVVVFLERTHGNRTRTARDSKLVLVRAPAHGRCGPVEAEENERRLPDERAVHVWHLRPDVCVAVLRARHETVRARRPVEASDELVVLSERVLDDPAVRGLRIDRDVRRVLHHSDARAVCIERVRRERRVGELVHLERHLEDWQSTPVEVGSVQTRGNTNSTHPSIAPR